MKPLILALPAAFLLSSCGSVSSVQPASGTVVGGKTFSKVVVRDFAYRGAADQENGPASSQTFANYISTAVSKKGAFHSVGRSGKVDTSTLVVEGEITRFVEGNAALRFLVGMGAGSSYFDADVRFVDGSNGSVLGTIKADKNSWGLGGSLAAGQTVDTFMNGAASKVADESVKFSKGGAQR